MLNSVVSPFRVAGMALELWWRNWVPLATTNLAWALCWLTIVLGPPATLALLEVAGSLARGEDGGVRDFWRALRTHFLLAWGWFLVSALISLLLGLGLLYYARLESLWGVGLWGLSLGLSLLWVAVLFYNLPFLLADPARNLFRGYRNALFTALASPLYTLALLVLSALALAVSAVLVALVFLGGPALVAVLAAVAVQDRMQAYGVAERDASP